MLVSCFLLSNFEKARKSCKEQSSVVFNGGKQERENSRRDQGNTLLAPAGH